MKRLSPISEKKARAAGWVWFCRSSKKGVSVYQRYAFGLEGQGTNLHAQTKDRMLRLIAEFEAKRTTTTTKGA